MHDLLVKLPTEDDVRVDEHRYLATRVPEFIHNFLNRTNIKLVFSTTRVKLNDDSEFVIGDGGSQNWFELEETVQELLEPVDGLEFDGLDLAANFFLEFFFLFLFLLRFWDALVWIKVLEILLVEGSVLVVMLMAVESLLLLCKWS